jgi:hypothetical protein
LKSFQRYLFHAANSVCAMLHHRLLICYTAAPVAMEENMNPVLQILIQSTPAAAILWGLTVIYYANRHKNGMERQRILLGFFAIGTALIWAGLPSEVINQHADDLMAVWGLALTALAFWATAIRRISQQLRNESNPAKKQ